MELFNSDPHGTNWSGWGWRIYSQDGTSLTTECSLASSRGISLSIPPLHMAWAPHIVVVSGQLLYFQGSWSPKEKIPQTKSEFSKSPRWKLQNFLCSSLGSHTVSLNQGQGTESPQFQREKTTQGFVCRDIWFIGGHFWRLATKGSLFIHEYWQQWSLRLQKLKRDKTQCFPSNSKQFPS